MAYEPRGKVKVLVDAMRADPERVWTSPEAAKVMEVHQGALSAHLDTAVRNACIYRRLEAGRCQYALKPFDAPPPLSVPAATWTPPRMVAPRPGSDQPAAPSAPAPAPVAAEAEHELEEVQEDSAPEFDACMWLDGTLTIYGAQENEDGSISLLPDQVTTLRRRLAWAPVQ